MTKTEKTRNAYLVKTYGITLDQYNDMLTNQGHVCKLCGQEFRTDFNGWKPVVDHDHDTKEIRGIIHSACNYAIGVIAETPEARKRLATYFA